MTCFLAVYQYITYSTFNFYLLPFWHNYYFIKYNVPCNYYLFQFFKISNLSWYIINIKIVPNNCLTWNFSLYGFWVTGLADIFFSIIWWSYFKNISRQVASCVQFKDRFFYKVFYYIHNIYLMDLPSFSFKTVQHVKWLSCYYGSCIPFFISQEVFAS